MGGRQILSTGSLREMHRVRMLENNWTQGNAIGFAVRRERDKVYVSHGGGYPGYQTKTLLQLDGKVGVIVLTNADDSNPGAIATQLMNTVGEAVAKAAAAPATTTTWDPSWSRFAGLYRGRGGESQVVELNKRLVIITPNAANLDNPIRLEPIGNGRFRYVARRRRRPGRRDRAVRRRRRARRPHVRRRQLRRARAVARKRRFQSCSGLGCVQRGRSFHAVRPTQPSSFMPGSVVK